ncbi:hypothetical protein FSP39_007619 [Pinctada imbricata]|uniref:Fucosyltransferase n=1 Tax=Pinctada imbricata TaxID=66713 RepID=A0AA88YQK7_PINIB|nr:hypothetical protein FSP39_007619 [Pinctada imbricata]
MRLKVTWLWFICTSLTLVTLLVVTFWSSRRRVVVNEESIKAVLSSVSGNDILTPPKHKMILYFNAPPHFQGYEGENVFKKCNVSNCSFSTRAANLNYSNVVIFGHSNLPEVPPLKELGQIWVFTSSESPSHTNMAVTKDRWKGKFNWTMSYRRHSDFYFGYGKIFPRKVKVERDYSAIFDQKDKDVAWIVSHCGTQSRREEYARQMARYVSMDTYGICGDKNCDVYKGNENDSCHDVVSKKYKFYLSFENNICKDYTTEKFYFPFTFDKPIMPVARGAYNMREYVPSVSYIDASDFPSPRHLARYLSSVASNKTEYIRLLKLKDEYTSKTSPETFEDSLCAMCEALHGDIPAKIADVNDVIFKDQCKDPTDLSGDKSVQEIGLNALGRIVSKLKDSIS